MILNKYTKCIIADAAMARSFIYDKSEHAFKADGTLEHEAGKLKEMELQSDNQGRYQKSATWNEGTYEPHTDAKTKELNAFSKQISDHLNREFQNQAFSNLIFIAPGKLQGYCKQNLNKYLLDKTLFIDKHYVNLDEETLKTKLSEIIKTV